MSDQIWYLQAGSLGEYCVKAANRKEARAILAAFAARAAAGADAKPAGGIEWAVGAVIGRDLVERDVDDSWRNNVSAVTIRSTGIADLVRSSSGEQPPPLHHPS